ncbi:phosphate/phosphite/phosphonate ABC transporter substrate-binding protein [Tropicimonas aquimaris]|uniref:Phosphate/phosphite/phosphonate ABC transporter substrate-binding protein n=1 Tax=Tropicimonas aquimaris TaxID=914152 RepID=A0ABW3ILP1_9RHOB
MIATLPMYDHPGVREATDALWAAIRERLRAEGIAAPEELSRSDDLFALWRSPNLLLGQICGLPVRTEFHASVTLLGAIDYGLEDTPPGHYHSLFVVRDSDPRSELSEFEGASIVYNEAVSHSGWAVAAFAPVRFQICRETGSHRDSVRALGDGEAEIAAIDAISWRLLQAHTDLASGLKIVGRSPATPGQALVTAQSELACALRRAIAGGIADLAEQHRTALGARGFVEIPLSDYMAVPIPPDPEAYALEYA